MNAFVSQILPLLYGISFLVLLWQAFKVMAQGFKAVPRPGDRIEPSPDRTGKLTVHPELLDGQGQITQEDLLTVRFSGDNERPVHPN